MRLAKGRKGGVEGASWTRGGLPIFIPERVPHIIAARGGGGRGTQNRLSFSSKRLRRRPGAKGEKKKDTGFHGEKEGCKVLLEGGRVFISF